MSQAVRERHVTSAVPRLRRCEAIAIPTAPHLDAASPEVYEVSYDAATDHFVATASATAAKDIRGAYPIQRDGLVDVAGMPVELVVKDTPSDSTPETTVVGGAGLNTYYDETFRTLSFYPRDVVYDVDASQSPLEVLRDIINRLNADIHKALNRIGAGIVASLAGVIVATLLSGG